ncbi:MAG TPA: phosphoglycerate kinase, partial [Longimicrobiales bacterium]|nr:phosphoglycerate kinase [Longimicrobiales bacterium]
MVLLSHLGRPKGTPRPELSLRPVAERLRQLLGGEVEVRFVDRVAGPEVRKAAGELPAGGVLLVENTRFDPGETSGDEELAEGWADLADIFVNDAFGAAHRAHASTTGIARAVRRRGGQAVAGLLMEKELDFLGRALEAPERPFVAILGGAKISGKIDVIHALLPRVDRLLIGGAMANTFFLALGLDVGHSLVEEDRVDTARATLEEAGDALLLPVDCVVADDLAVDAATRVVPRDGVGSDETIGDVGSASRETFASDIAGARTLLWNGPMGVFELEPFREGTVAVARAVARATDQGALSVVGGGDSAAAAEVAGVTDRLSHVSTGGGASLEFLSGAELPGVAALSDTDGEEA